MSRILVAGCGYIGSVLAARLAREGHDVWGLRRRRVREIPGVRSLCGDLTRPDTVAALPGALEFVFYTVGADGRDDSSYQAAYVTGLRVLLETLVHEGQSPRRIFFTSSTAVYGQSDGEWVDESSPTAPRGFTGRRLLEGESLLRAGPFPASVVRLAGIYGPGRTRLIEAVRAGRPLAPPGPCYTNRIHRDDAAGLLAHVLGLGGPAPVYVGVDDEPASLDEVLGWIAAGLGVVPPPATAAHRAHKRCRNRRLTEAGYRLRYPSYREGYTALLDASEG